METRTFSELLEDITEVLSNYDCNGLAQVASEILAKKVQFVEMDNDNYEWIFEVE
jgi:hypothetical protein